MIDFDSQYSVAWCSLASSAEAAGNLTEAESHYQRAISLYPPARLPRLLYTEYLERHNLARDGFKVCCLRYAWCCPMGLPIPLSALCGVWRQVRELDSPESLLAVDCDPFRLL